MRINTSRNLPNGLGIQKSYQANLVDQPCMIQPLSATYSAQLNMVFGKAYNLFLPLGTDVIATDHITDQNGKKYTVTGSQLRNYGNSAPHATYIITEQVVGGPDI